MPPNIQLSIRTTDHVEQVVLAPSKTFSYEVIGPKIAVLDTFIEAYLAKEQAPLPPLNLSSLTPFTQKVLKTLKTIPFGSTQTYSELAAQIGSPRGSRAVGGALGRNPFPLLLPCHRIVAKKDLGGFSLGLPLKQILLEYESFFY